MGSYSKVVNVYTIDRKTNPPENTYPYAPFVSKRLHLYAHVIRLYLDWVVRVIKKMEGAQLNDLAHLFAGIQSRKRQEQQQQQQAPPVIKTVSRTYCFYSKFAGIHPYLIHKFFSYSSRLAASERKNKSPVHRPRAAADWPRHHYKLSHPVASFGMRMRLKSRQ